MKSKTFSNFEPDGLLLSHEGVGAPMWTLVWPHVLASALHCIAARLHG